jgi:2-polyprenyl-3-methyl-5-hydroxy-6-metoxy-1,4-benzoquinol methylase
MTAPSSGSSGSSLRRYLRRFELLRSAYLFVLACRQAFLASPRRMDAEVETAYAEGEDPWNYATSPAERRRYVTALQLLEAEGLGRPESCLEVGCGEGFFTEQLAPRCRRLLAVDHLPVALDRAAGRVEYSNVNFRRWDLREDPPLGVFNLVVCMDVLPYIAQPRAKQRAIDKLAASVAPGGGLLLSELIQPAIIDKSRWSRWLMVGANSVGVYLGGRNPPLVLCGTKTTEMHRVSLFRAPRTKGH